MRTIILVIALWAVHAGPAHAYSGGRDGEASAGGGAYSGGRDGRDAYGIFGGGNPTALKMGQPARGGGNGGSPRNGGAVGGTDGGIGICGCH